MLETIFPLSFKVKNLFTLIALTAVYIFVPIFIAAVGSNAGIIPYVSTVAVILDIITAVYCVGGITVAFLRYFRVIGGE